MDIKEIQIKLAKFTQERDWDQFHSPKNLVMALTSEVGELNEIFQWLTEEQSLQVMAILDGIYRSQEEGKEVTLDI